MVWLMFYFGTLNKLMTVIEKEEEIRIKQYEKNHYLKYKKIIEDNKNKRDEIELVSVE